MITSGFDVFVMDSKIVHPWVHADMPRIMKGKGLNVKDNMHWPYESLKMFWQHQYPLRIT
jgi:hypothetical protein